MDKSIFTDKNSIPGKNDLVASLGDTYNVWQFLSDYVHQQYPDARDEWNYPGDKYGWSLRIKDKKRAIIYLLPRDQFFKTAFVFGQKATDMIMKSQVSPGIKTELGTAKVYTEGRGIRMEVKDAGMLNDLKILIDIKLNS